MSKASQVRQKERDAALGRGGFERGELRRTARIWPKAKPGQVITTSDKHYHVSKSGALVEMSEQQVEQFKQQQAAQ